jgi:hypothetical protein
MPLLPAVLTPFSTLLKPLGSTRFSGFLLFFSLGVALYLTDCLFSFKDHPDLPWYATGIYSGPRGFPVTIAVFVFAFFNLFFGRSK